MTASKPSHFCVVCVNYTMVSAYLAKLVNVKMEKEEEFLVRIQTVGMVQDDVGARLSG